MIALLRRVQERLKRGEQPPCPTLPPGKTDFPKLLCLDTNKWIELARAHYGKDERAEMHHALAVVRSAVAKGRLVVPVFSSNLAEAAEANSDARRNRLATFMVDLSRNISFMHPVILREAEAEGAIRVHIVGQKSVSPIRPTVLGWGMDLAAMGRELRVPIKDPALEILINQAAKEPEISVATLAHALGRDTVGKLRRIDLEGAKLVEAVRVSDRNLSPAMRHRLEMRNLLTGGSLADQVRQVLSRLRVSSADFEEWLNDDERLEQLTRGIPSVSVQASLMLARDRNPGDRTQPNDAKDFSFLKQAIPYGNLIVTEKRWAHLATVIGIAREYSATVLSSLTELPTAITIEGCA